MTDMLTIVIVGALVAASIFALGKTRQNRKDKEAEKHLVNQGGILK